MLRTSVEEIFGCLCGILGMVIGGCWARWSIAMDIAQVRAREPDLRICGLSVIAYLIPLAGGVLIGGFVGATLGLIAYRAWTFFRKST